MLEMIKTGLRISHDKLDNDIQHNIDAALADLARVGVYIPADETDYPELVKKATDLYVKWQYDYGGKGEEYRKHYESTRDSMATAEAYINGGD